MTRTAGGMTTNSERLCWLVVVLLSISAPIDGWPGALLVLAGLSAGIASVIAGIRRAPR